MPFKTNWASKTDADSELADLEMETKPEDVLAEIVGHSRHAPCSDALIQTSCGDCGTAMTLRVVDGSLEPAIGIAHFAVPAAHWWARHCIQLKNHAHLPVGRTP